MCRNTLSVCSRPIGNPRLCQRGRSQPRSGRSQRGVPRKNQDHFQHLLSNQIFRALACKVACRLRLSPTPLAGFESLPLCSCPLTIRLGEAWAPVGARGFWPLRAADLPPSPCSRLRRCARLGEVDFVRFSTTEWTPSAMTRLHARRRFYEHDTGGREAIAGTCCARPWRTSTSTCRRCPTGAYRLEESVQGRQGGGTLLAQLLRRTLQVAPSIIPQAFNKNSARLNRRHKAWQTYRCL